jgi:hypothetical protein
MKKMKKLLLIPVLLFALSFNTFAQQKEMKTVDLKAKKMDKARGENPKIKQEFVFNAPDVAVQKPEETRGSLCTVNTINDTGYTVYVYVDGNYKGYVNPWSEGDVTVGKGYTTIYVRTSGGTYYWEKEGNCDYYYNYRIKI